MPAKSVTSNKTITNRRTPEEIRQYLADHWSAAVDPDTILREAEKEFGKKSNSNLKLGPESDMLKAMTLVEFENGALLTTAVPTQYTTFGIDMMRRLQKECNCTSIIEKSLAELTTVSYIRTLAIQTKINSYLSLGEFTDMGVKYLAVLSKELDRAHRHYLTAIQTLRSIKQPPLQVKVTTDTAIIGQNQVVQANHD